MISVSENGKYPVFHLKNAVSSLMFRVRQDRVELVHYGRPVQDGDLSALAVRDGTGWGTAVLHKGLCSDVLPLLWSSTGSGDYRESPVALYTEDGPASPDFVYKGYRTDRGCAPLPGLPRAHGDCETLYLTLQSELCDVTLTFSVFETVIIRSTAVTARRGLRIGKCMSQMLDLPGQYTMLTLDGGWICETHLHETPVGRTRICSGSDTGFSSNRHNPGFVLEDGENVYGFNLVYSGNHYASAQRSLQGLTRVMQGISPEGFLWPLQAGETFYAPEAVLCYSSRGRNGLRANMHAFVNGHVIPDYWNGRERPVLFNNWEGTMFSFTEKKLLALAARAKKLGCELFVMDDGWFQGRNDDTAGLGDYAVNKGKLPNGLEALADRIRETGMKFGLWFEPEAVNPDSDLYRAHPDWAIPAAEEDLLSRNELLLDLRRAEVRDYIVENVSHVIDAVGADYVKWDMNRHSVLTGADAHRYILGLYDVLERIFSPRREILLESCASGGNRFDLGMLCYGPQIWASDDTDPVERLEIQSGLNLLYPLSTISCHVSDSPHVQTLRKTPLSTRINVSMFGVFGVEMDLELLSDVDLSELKAAVAFYKNHRRTFQFGLFSEQKQSFDAAGWCVTSEEESLAGVFCTLRHAAPGYEFLRISGLPEEERYDVCSREQLLRAGIIAGLLKFVAPVHLHPEGWIARTANRHFRLKDGAFRTECSGAALQSGIALNPPFAGTGYDLHGRNGGDFSSWIYRISRRRRGVLKRR